MSRYGYEIYDEQRPVTWWRGYPVFAAHFIIIVYVASMLATTVLLFAQAGRYLDWLSFDSAAVWRGEVWRWLSYGLVNPPSFQFAIDMLMILWFGREVERHLGRRRFFALYGGIYLAKPLLFTVLGLWVKFGFAGEMGAFALFVAFATLFPNAPLLFNILAKWAALVLLGLISLMALASRNWIELVETWTTCGYAFVFVRYQQGLIALPRLQLWRRRPRLRVLPDPEPTPSRKAAPAAPKPASMAEVDALLDKIAQSGIGSLTSAERAKLEAARSELLKREGGRR